MASQNRKQFHQYKNILVSIEGNIGGGKSTLLSKLEEIFGTSNIINKPVIFLQEPVKQWATIKDENDVTIIEKFYADQKTYSFPFQMMAYISRLALLKEAYEQNENAIIITERSLYTDRFVFAKMLFDSGNIEFINYQIYLKWFDTFVIDYPVDFVIYVKADPEICHARITERSRKGEDNIPLDYLKSCHDYHEEMLDEKQELVVKKEFILTLDGNQNIYTNPENLSEWIEKISKFIGL
jgi:deoxyadenosine/deoxycytidine kinase